MLVLTIVVLSLCLGLLLCLSLCLNPLYRRLVLGFLRTHRHEPYIREQKPFRRQFHSALLALSFITLSLWFLLQWAWQVSAAISGLEGKSAELSVGGIWQISTVPVHPWRIDNLLLGYLLVLMLLALLALALLLLIAAIDYKLQLIPNILVLSLAGVLIVVIFLSPEQLLILSLIRALLLYLGLRLLVAGLNFLSTQQGLGLGDIHLLTVLSLWFNFYSCLLLIILACCLGLVYIFTHNRLYPHRPALRTIAFGPWIVCASIVMFQIL